MCIERSVGFMKGETESLMSCRVTVGRPLDEDLTVKELLDCINGGWRGDGLDELLSCC